MNNYRTVSYPVGLAYLYGRCEAMVFKVGLRRDIGGATQYRVCGIVSKNYSKFTSKSGPAEVNPFISPSYSLRVVRLTSCSTHSVPVDRLCFKKTGPLKLFIITFRKLL